MTLSSHIMKRASTFRAALLLIVAAVAGLARPVAAVPQIQFARAHPDFSGTWTLVRNDITRAEGAKDPLTMFTFGSPLTIRQDASLLTIGVWHLKLDGTSTTDPTGSVISGTWDGEALVVTLRQPAVGAVASVEHRCVLHFEADGTRQPVLTVDLTTIPVADVTLVHSIYRRAEPEPGVPVGGVYRAGNGVTAPILVRDEKPQYTSQATRAGVQGTVELDITVRSDGSVDPDAVTITRSVDKVYGLDEQAIAAAKRWRFRPAVDTSTGKAVPCRVSIVMTFTLGSITAF